MKKIPYYEPSKSVKDQIIHSSEKRKHNKFVFLFKKIRNHCLESIAFNNPVNSIRVWCHRKRGVKIGKGVMLGMGCVLDHAFPEYITMEDNTALAGNVYILTHSNPYKHFEGILDSYIAPVVIKEGAWVGINEQCRKYKNAHQLAGDNLTNILCTADLKDFSKEEIRKDIEKETINPTLFLVWFVENYPESVKIMKENPEYQKRFK